jgi:RNA polymerase sigma factor (sigma-70 family)
MAGGARFTPVRTVDEDTDVVDRCLQGDEGAFADLFRRHEARAVRLAYALVGDRAAAEDVKQEAFLRAFRSLERMHRDVAFSTWLSQNLIWAAGTLRRRGHWRREVAGFAEPIADGRTEFERQEVRATLVGALQTLPPSAREVVALRFYLDLPEAEIARIVGCRPGTVKSRLSRALRLLASSPAVCGLKEPNDVL